MEKVRNNHPVLKCKVTIS